MKPLNLLIAALMSAATVPASATVVFDFYKLGSGGAGDFLPTDGVACTGGDLCSSNVDGGARNGDLTFSAGGITARATGTFNGVAAAVVQDHEPGYTLARSAGLGIYHLSGDSSDDNITAGELLTLTFDRTVTLSSIGLRSDGHTFTDWSSGATFLFNGASTLLPQNVGSIALNQTGQVFTFGFGGRQADQFYLASMSVTAVPEPGTYALVGAGLGMMALISRRRRQPD